MIRSTDVPRGSESGQTSDARTAARRRARVVAAIAVTAALVALTGCQTEPEVPSPTDAATAYLQALADGDASAANALSTPASEKRPRPSDSSLDGVEPITDISAADVPDYDSVSSDVPVSYSLDGEEHEAELSLVFVDGAWLVSRGLEGNAAVKWIGYSDDLYWWSDLNHVTVGTTSVQQFGVLGVLYPGIYDVSPNLGPYAELVSTTITFVPREPNFPAVPVGIEVAPTAQVATEVVDTLSKHLDAVLAQAEERPASFYADIGPRAQTFANESPEGSSVKWSVAVPVKVEPWQFEDSVGFDATATIAGSWKKGSKSGLITIPLTTHVLAHPTASAQTLDALPTFWQVAD